MARSTYFDLSRSADACLGSESGYAQRFQCGNVVKPLIWTGMLGTIQPTGKRMDAPCCDVFRLKNGKIQSFNCYPSGTVIFAQLGVLSNIEAAVARS